MKITQENFKNLYESKARAIYNKSVADLTLQERYQTLGLILKDHIELQWDKSKSAGANQKQMYYISIEFLIGRLLGSNVLNLGLQEIVKNGLAEFGIDFSEMEDVEPDAGLGNGGLGRLAACFLDSLASLDLPGHGMGLRYKHGLFEQRIVDGYQTEVPDQWLASGNAWEVKRPEEAQTVKFWGNVDADFKLQNYEEVLAVPYDMPVVGYETTTINTLRLWSAQMSKLPTNKDLATYKRETEEITDTLYPEDGDDAGKILRLKQQYFLVSATLQDVMKKHKAKHGNFDNFNDYVTFHINDTHPTMTIPEMMRILLDDEGLSWDTAWDLTVKTCAYTNHTILAEAMEKWPVHLFQPLLPRIYQIIEEINKRFCAELINKYAHQPEKIEKMSIICHGMIRMANLSVVGSYSTNGVAALHTEILKEREMNLFYQLYPHRFNNKTNGITFRRWLFQSNPELTALIQEKIGTGFMRDSTQLEKILPHANDANFLSQLAAVKREKKVQLAEIIKRENGVDVDPDSMFIIKIKRLHGYKRQLMNAMHVMSLYNALKANPDMDVPARTFIFGAKSAPGYAFAKKVIKLINLISNKVNNDPETNGKLKVVFLENYRVSLAEYLFPAADISEQISTATKEASGTGNMKFMLNGALTLGTMDGANVEIVERVGRENAFIFGLDKEQVMAYNRHGGYRPLDEYHADKRIRQVIEQLVNGFFADVNASYFEDIYYELLHCDEYFILKDFAGYADAHDRAAATFVNKDEWFKRCAINIAHAGFFSSDRTIADYAKNTWNITKQF